jgi:hypothetical protein
VTYLVTIAGMEEKAAKPADGARWGESTVTLMLEEGVAGAIAAPAGWFLDDLDDVTLGALADGHVLTYDSGTGRWGNEPSGGAHTHDLLYQTLDEDLTTLAAIADVEGDLLIRGASGWERLAKGAGLQALRMNAGATRPEWGVGGLDFEFYMDANGAAAGPAIFDFFGANSAFPTEAGAIYEIVASLFFLKTTAGTATVTLTNTQAYTNLSGRRVQSAATGMAANGGLVGSAIVNDTLAASPHAASAALTTAVEHPIEARWRAQIGLAGNIRIRLTQSAGTATPLRGSFYTVRKLAGNVGSFVQ